MIRFQYFHAYRRPWLFGAVVGAIALTLIVPAMREPVGEAIGLVIAGFVSLAILAIAPYWSAKKQHAALDYMRGPVTLTYSAEGFSGTAPGASWTNTWSNLKFVRETKSFFLLYQLPQMALIIPKRFFETPEQMETWRRLASSGIAPKRIERPGLVARWC
jgi:hypothetical protein